MKKLSSYTAPIFGILCLLLADYTVFKIQPVYDTGAVIFYVIYNLLILLTIWSLASTLFSDPGFIPLKYKYNMG